MPKLKREMFLRPNRMTHRFGEQDDPITRDEYFEGPYPELLKSGGSKPMGIKTHGRHAFTEAISPVDKFKGGSASLSGPKLDHADEIAEREPVSTKRRRVPDGAI